jgi:outer membrane protein assembly factor BamA
LLLILSGSLCCPGAGHTQDTVRTTPRGWEFAGVPALNYDADEGFGYGVVAEIYQYGGADHQPYLYTIQPTVFLTTGGRRDFTVFFDSPHLLLGGWRIDAFLGSERQIASPYYGLGNETPFDETANDGVNPYYYRFGRTRRAFSVNVQRPFWRQRLRLLLGVRASHVAVKPVPKDERTTLLQEELAPEGEVPGGWSNGVRLGLIWDTRDREVGTRNGTWTELVVQRADPVLGSESGYTRWSAADRRYVALGSRTTLANRLLLQNIHGNPPFYDLFLVQTSFKQQEGLGGAKTVRGVLKNRYTGRGLFLWNLEIRRRVADFRTFGRSFHVVLSGFVDSGRVWKGGVEVGEIISDLHHGRGGGARLGMGENFVVALDAGHGSETALQIYIGLGYLF